MAQARDGLRRADGVRTAGDRLALLADHGGAARRTLLRHLPGAAVRRTRLDDHPDDLGDHVAGPAQEHAISNAHVLAAQLVLVVQRGAADRHPPHVDGLQRGDRRQRTRPPHADEDVLDGGGFFLGGELVRDGPAGRARDRSQAAPLVLRVDLDDAAVDLVRQLVAHREHPPVLVLHPLERLAELVVRIRSQAQLAQQRQLLPVRRERHPRRVAHFVEEDAERALGGDAGI